MPPRIDLPRHHPPTSAATVFRYAQVFGACRFCRANFSMKKMIPLLLLPLAALVRADSIGEVDTVFKLIGPDHKIVVDAHDDPKVAGVTCYVSRAKTGGIKGALGVAEDKSEASIDCQKVGPIAFAAPISTQ